jgi:hypothetical protein
VSFAVIISVASQRVFIVDFVIDSVRKLLDTILCVCVRVCVCVCVCVCVLTNSSQIMPSICMDG